jgi:cytochrome b subunit of formate dehydrogenase
MDSDTTRRETTAEVGHSHGGGAGSGEIPLDSAQRGRGPYIWRFTFFHRLMHAFAIISFYVLVLTGMPLRFACAPFAEPLIRLWGGVERAGLIHRWMAGFMVAYSLVHIFWLVGKIATAKDKKRWLWGSNSLVPHPQDAKDFFKQFKWFLGRGPRPQFGRYGYLEKLDYFGEIWGFVIIGGSGFMLWFPELFSRWLPGWSFNVATVFHAYEAMIAAAFLFMIHFFNVHLRPDKFPLDAVMFTGRGTMDYMVEEHPLMAEELEARATEPISERAIPDRVAPPPSRAATILATVFGLFAWGVGLAIVGMVIWALLC